MLTRIILTGTDSPQRAAAVFAERYGIPWGGWIAARAHRDLPADHSLAGGLTLSPDDALHDAMQQNILDADGVLLLSYGRQAGAVPAVMTFTGMQKRPLLQIDLDSTIAFQAARDISDWIMGNDVQVLNLVGAAGERTSEGYQTTLDILETVGHLLIMAADTPSRQNSSGPPGRFRITGRKPTTVEDVVDLLISRLSLRDRVNISNMRQQELKALTFTLGEYMRNDLQLWKDNAPLVQACTVLARGTTFLEDDACVIIVDRLWQRLKTTHRLRLV